ncbi:MAG: hypothetical protein QOE59_2310 [Actinomycetota bacterium]|jgi:hypothetical protein|nr:hypothetical protein [Actinomycetota bacterium]
MSTFDPRIVHTHPHNVGQSSGQQFGTGQFPGQPLPGAVPPPSRPSRKLPLAAKIVAGFVAVGLVAGGAGAYLAFSGGTAEAAVQSTSFAGANPTTSPFGTDAPQVAAVGATGPQAGDTKGLYAATTPPACTTADFLSQLQADPNKLAAFGGVFGLGATDVPAFVDSLAPVVLRANTSVTDHPFSGGAFVEQPAILAAGTAVLVNSYGEPTVKCFNGNPLTGGAPVADAISVIPTEQVITQYSFTSIDNSTVVVIPGKPDPKPHPGPNPTTTPQPDPELVKKAEEAKATAAQARTEATAAREKADNAAAESRRAQTNLTGAQADLDRAVAEGANPAVIAELTKVRDQAKQDAETKANQAKYADAAATSAEGTADQADKNAKDAQDKADASAKAPATEDEKKDQDKPAEAKKVDDPAAATGAENQTPGTEGQTNPAQVQKPGTIVQACPAIVTDATATPECKLPTGSADAGQKAPAAKGTATTDGEKTSTGSTSQGSGSSNSTSSSSQSSSKGGSGK